MNVKLKSLFMKLIFSALLPAAVGGAAAEAGELSAEEIMNRVDDNQHLVSARVESEMIIEDRGREIKKEMKSYIRTDNGRSDGLSEFLNPRDRGTKYLKLGDDMWMYFPDAEDLVHISGHMLRQGMMGSDFSYEDILESDKLTELYTFELEKTEILDDRETYVIYATAAKQQEPSYKMRRIWVDTERFVVLKEQYFSAAERLLKELITKRVEEFNGRWLPVEQVMNDKLRDDTRTTFRIKDIQLDYNIPEGLISLDTLQ